MLPEESNSLLYKKHGITTTLSVVVMLLLFLSCGRKKTDVGDAITERDSLPMMSTYGVETFISDSGITKYKIITEEWLVYDKKDPPYWSFERGLYLEKFDTLFNIEANIKADTAYYYDKQRLWELRNNVEIQNMQGEKFETDLLFWDQNTEKVYSDKYIRIEQIDRIITGYGFESNQQMTNYRILNMGGIFYVDETNPAGPDVASPVLGDSVSTNPAASGGGQILQEIPMEQISPVN